MVDLRTEYPFQMPDGTLNEGLIKHWAEDENGKRYLIKQVETEMEYDEPVDVFPCPYTYIVTNILAEKLEEEILLENLETNE